MDAFYRRKATSRHSIIPPIATLSSTNELTRRILSTFRLYTVAILIAFYRALLRQLSIYIINRSVIYNI